MQIPVSAYSMGTGSLNPQGLKPQVIRIAIQPLARRKPKHTELLFFAAAHRVEGATLFSSLIWFPSIPWGAVGGYCRHT